ncbi:calcitonin/calcitonin-related polypeptide, alpha [Pseudoliparis swirei]|uniref:calcitonin/calcitonin-related polypeptide, alpha n=1 Tax=Pseudoliparis swirei TaxID=2059687 RepID=UPI0024BE70D5|nr:calcitonin/calcitonin-related polypeptide, alpha [Pseudoliparis swirei]
MCFPQGIMIMLKLLNLLLACALISCQMYNSQAAPSRTSKESMLDGVMQSNNDAQRLLRAFKEFMQITSDEQEHNTADGTSLDRPLSKRCIGLSTCMLGQLSQDIHKLQTYPRTNVGAETPGKKRSLSEPFENYGNSYN